MTRALPRPVENTLRARYDVQLNTTDRQLSAGELRAALREADVLLCTLGDQLSADVLEVADRRVQLLANFGAGTNHIDLAAARRLGVAVTNTPGVLTEDTADCAMLLMLAVARRASEGERELRAGEWSGWRPTHLLGTRVSGKRLGVVGFGRIGQAVARRAHFGFGMHVSWVSGGRTPIADDVAPFAMRASSLHALCESVDFLSLHCPSTAETRHLIGDEELRRMPSSAFLINTSRGDVVDEPALIRALAQRSIAGAGLDVFEREPLIPAELLQLSNVVLLPHLGSATTESREAMGFAAVANIDAFAADLPLPNAIVPRSRA